MKSDRLSLTLDEIERMAGQFADHEHFKSVVLPRLWVWLGVKEHCGNGDGLLWTFRWSPTNLHRNEVAISLPDQRGEFHFYYAIPLMQSLRVLLFLGDNTFNFFEAFPLLVKNGVLGEKEFPVDATLNSLPCLVLSKPGAVYPYVLIEEASRCAAPLQTAPVGLVEMMDGFFGRFNAGLMSIINGDYRL